MDAHAPNEPSTFEHLMLTHMDAAYNLATWLLRDRHEAEDAVQDAYMRAYKAFSGFRGGDGRAWLLTIVRNVSYSRLRQNRRGPKEVAFEDEVHGSVEDPTRAVEWSEVRGELLQRGLERLPPEFREVIVLHEIEGLAYREIASISGIPIGTVMSRLSRARGKLQAEVLSLASEQPTR